MLRLNPNCPLLLRSRSAPLLTTWVQCYQTFLFFFFFFFLFNSPSRCLMAWQQVRSDNVATRVGNQRYKIGTKKRSSSLNDIRQTSPRKRGEPFQPVTSAAGKHHLLVFLFFFFFPGGKPYCFVWWEGFQVYQEVEKWETPREKEEAGCYRKYFAGKGIPRTFNHMLRSSLIHLALFM